MNNSIKTIFIKIAKKLYEDGIPITTGYSGKKSLVFDGLFEISYTRPNVEADGTITISCLGDVSGVKHKTKNISGTNRIAGDLYQGVVGGIFLPTDDFVSSIEKNIGEYLKVSAGVDDAAKVSEIIDRLIEDIINNVPIKGIYKTLKHDSPREFSKIMTVYRQKYRSDLLEGVEGLVQEQGQYAFEFHQQEEPITIEEARKQKEEKLKQDEEERKKYDWGDIFKSASIRTAAEQFKTGDHVKIKDMEGLRKYYESRNKDENSKNMIGQIDHVINFAKSKDLDIDKIYIVTGSAQQDPENFLIIAGQNSSGSVVPMVIYKELLLKTNTEESAKFRKMAQDIGLSKDDAFNFEENADVMGLRPAAFMAYLKEAKNAGKLTSDSNGKIDLKSFEKLLSTGFTRIPERAKKYNLSPDEYFRNLMAAGREGLSYEEFINKDKKEAGNKDGKVENTLSDENGGENGGEDKEIQALQLVLKNKKIPVEVLKDILIAAKYRSELVDIYKGYKQDNKLKMLPKIFSDTLEKISNHDAYVKAVLERYKISPEIIHGDDKIIDKNFKQLTIAIDDMKKNGIGEKDIPRDMIYIYKSNLDRVATNFFYAALERQGASRREIQDMNWVKQNIGKVVTSLRATKQNFPGYENPRIEKLIKNILENIKK